jgi:hypothetical protein
LTSKRYCPLAIYDLKCTWALGTAALTSPEVNHLPPFPSDLMTAYPVSPKMIKASFNEPAAIAPLEPVVQ